MSLKQIQSNKGFTLGEVLLVVGLIAICGYLVSQYSSHATQWAKQRAEKWQLKVLNDALEVFKLEAASENILLGKNDFAHHEAVIQALEVSGYLHFKKLFISQLASEGEGKAFRFVAYGNAKVEGVKEVKKRDEIHSQFLDWLASDKQKAWQVFNGSKKNIEKPNTNKILEQEWDHSLPQEIFEKVLNEYHLEQ